MSTLSTLIKQTKQQLEALQKEIFDIQQRIATLNAEQQQLKADSAKSFRDAQQANDPQQLQMALQFIAQQEQKHAALETQKQAQQDALEAINTQIRTHFAEQKRYEILLERQEAEARDLLMKKQQAELDDLAQRKAE